LTVTADDAIVDPVPRRMAPLPTQARAEELLRQMYGPGAEFRDGQLEAILATVDRRARTLLIQRTGWGKSLVYFVATKILRDEGLGPTLLISPLLSLMRNQVEAAQKIGIRAARIDSETADTLDDVETRLSRDEIDVLLVSPERLANERFQSVTLSKIPRGIGLLVVDEAHCISDWGHDFRPDYRRIVRIIRALPANVPVLATTATANQRVSEDIRAQLGDTLEIQRGPLTRESLLLQTIVLADQAERLAWLAQHVPQLPGSGIIYCLTTADCDRVARWLRENGVDAVAYHAKLEDDSRPFLEGRLARNEVKALVATVALGMGFDKPDLGFVVHYQRPGSLIAYYQQIGRAGRAGQDAYAVVLSGKEDDDIQEYFIRSAFPAVEQMTQVLSAVAGTAGISVRSLQAEVNLPRGKLEQCLKLLEVDGAIARDGSNYFRTANPWSADVERSNRVTATRYAELAAMQDFVGHRSCLMEFVARSLDDEHARPCGRCAMCREALVSTDVDPELVRQATAFLRRSHIVIEPRKQWPGGAVTGRAGRIRPGLQAAQGYALSMWGDAGWGQLVAVGKYQSGRFSDELVAACVELLIHRWRPDPFPIWVTAVPSRRRPSLVPDFAARLAAALELPFVAALEKIRDTPQQKTMENSAQQLANIAGTFGVVLGSIRPDPVLVVDDMVDSRWTFTEIAHVLRSAGVAAVYPLALASTAGAGGPE
jgi:ATP-dependent DNA helicase RecQ